MICRRRVASFALLAACTASAQARADEQACNTSYEQGQVLRSQQKLLEARQQLRTCVNSCTSESKKKDCGDWLSAVEKDIPTVVLSARDGAGTSLVTVTVSMDGKPVASTLDGKAIEVNPEPHTFAFQAADGTKVEVQVVVGEGERNKAVSATLGKPAVVEEKKAATAEPPAPQETAPAAPPAPTTDSPPREGSSSFPWKTMGLVTAGAGIVGLGLGTVFGLQAASTKSDAGCDSNSVCPSDSAANKLRDAGSAGNLATGFFVAGGVLAAGGIAMWALAPSAPVQAAPSAGTSGAGFVVRGTW